MKKFCIVLWLVFLLTNCDKDADYDKTKAVSAFVQIDPLQIDKALEKVEMKFSITERGFFKKVKEISFKKSSPLWFFYSGDIDDHFVFAPVIKNEKVFVLDTAGVLSAYDLVSEKKIWKSQIFKKSFLKNYHTPKISYADGKIFCIAGVNKIAAANQSDGKVLWSKEIAAIPVSTPVSDGKSLYVSTNDNKL